MKNGKNKNGGENEIKNLKKWIKENWRLKAKKVRRSNPPEKVQEQEKRFGGPFGFFLSEDLVVLVYFNGQKDYKVLAYPSELVREINWIRKPDGRVTFNPEELPDKFRFDSITEFKKEFLSRFPELVVTPTKDKKQ